KVGGDKCGVAGSWSQWQLRDDFARYLSRRNGAWRQTMRRDSIFSRGSPAQRNCAHGRRNDGGNLPRWDDRQQQGGWLCRPCVQRDLAAEYRRRAINFVVVFERTATAHRMFHVRQRRRRAIPDIILAADGQRNAVAP